MEREEEAGNARESARYTGSSTPAGSAVESERHGAPEVSYTPVFCVSAGDLHDATSEDAVEFDEGSGASATAHHAAVSELGAWETSNAEEPENVYERAFFIHRSQTPPLKALLGFSGTPRVSPQGQSLHRDRHGSVHFIAFSSATSDRTMIDHGASLDHVAVRTPDASSGARKGVLQAYLAQSVKGRHARASWSNPRLRKLSLTGSHARHASYNVYSCVVGDALRISVGGTRSTSCPVRLPRTETSSGPPGSCWECSTCLAPTETRTPSLSSTCCGTGVVRRHRSDELLQYRLAVQHAKKGRYGLSIRDVLANPDAADDEEEEQEEDSFALCE
ncbi:uncharacterized protein Tco025E_02342 [Trypanosoma conorhini]|uniref:Uncharacterized protein n=1 Tax=Trypanosoma conorhini TaxID=83891 RepID=A0A3R7LDK1_9TRYP|nr:uncharacterized protein Tco025E_02342 [Trypanosoma conorhini]RNF25109.1 hypothetical protein Tco025E_02342 [Trypanosoma conorhini]